LISSPRPALATSVSERARLGQRGRGEEPVVEVAAEAVQEQHRVAALALAQVPQRARADLDRLGLGACVLVALARHERRLELGHEGVDVGVRRLGVRHHREQPADRDRLAGRRDLPAQHAGHRALHGAVELVGLDLGHLVADGDLGPLVDQPRDEAALGHGQSPLGHAQLLDVGAHAFAVAPATSRTVAAIWSGVGT
jgi:hypothetical protein